MTVIFHSDEDIKYVHLRFGYILISILLIFISVFLIVTFNSFYKQHKYSGIYRTVAHCIPIPIATVNGDVVWYGQVSEIAYLLSSTNNDIEEDKIFEVALEASIRQKNVEHLADNLGITVSKDEIDNFLVEDDDMRFYLDNMGWNSNRYKKYIILPLLRSQKTEVALSDVEEYQNHPLDELKQALRDYDEIGVPFSDVAEQYSEDNYAIFGGDLGFYIKNDLIDGMEPVWGLGVDEVSDILDLGDRYAIVKVYDEIIEDGERTGIALQIISINKATLAEILDEFTQTQVVKIFLK